MSSARSCTATSFRTPIPWTASPTMITWKLCGGTRLSLVIRRMDNYLPEEEVLYFVNPLIYRVEINPIATVLGFRGTLSGIAIEVDGHEDRHWDEVLQVLNGSTVPAVRFLRRRETHQCRLVSYNWRRMRYLWDVRMLGYIDGTGWTFLEPGA